VLIHKRSINVQSKQDYMEEEREVRTPVNFLELNHKL